MTESIEAHITREASRRAAAQVQALHEEIAQQQEIIKQCQSDLLRQRDTIFRLSSLPARYAELLDIQRYPDPACFRLDDGVIVTDRSSPHYGKTGTIVTMGGTIVDDDGFIWVHLQDEQDVRLAIGLEGKSPAQVRLAAKPDGTCAVVAYEGHPWEINGVAGLEVEVGQTVKILTETKQIVGAGREYISGPICRVSAITTFGVEIEDKGEKRMARNPRNLALEEGDRIVLGNDLAILSVLEKDPRQRYKISKELNVTWADIGGLENAVQELKEVLELPYQESELYDFYKVKPVKGILLYGPPGCGKTLLARVAAWANAQQHNVEAMESGYIYVKSPEILDKWVGNSEAEIRGLFERGRKHFRDYGYKAILAMDEFDAIAPQRGTRRSSDVADTLVPMFLGEMDGIDPQQTLENPIVVAMTNRPDILDPAVTRPGRIDKHIRIDRPTELTAIDVLKIHTKGLPFKDEEKVVLAIACADLYSKSRLLYKVNGEHSFTLGDACSGAMLANLAEHAKMIALRRDRESKTKTGLTIADFREAITRIEKQQAGANHTFDLYDFAERKGLQPQNIQVERCFGAK